VRKRHFLRHLYIKCVILQRQARDKHRENSKKGRFLAVDARVPILHSDSLGVLYQLPYATSLDVGPPGCHIQGKGIGFRPVYCRESSISCAQKEGLFSTGCIFVPSLSWQTIVFHHCIEKLRTERFVVCRL
jgi:hypothetical protein